VYHRHDNPHSTNGEFRQVCIDKLVFSDSLTIEKVQPTHSGINLGKAENTQAPNLAFRAKASASSWYHLVANQTAYSPGGYNYSYLPENAVDNNNGTLWRAGSTRLPQSLVVDLGKNMDIKRVATQFEYPTYYYQYKIEVSTDSIHWTIFSDKTGNRRCGSPMIDDQRECPLRKANSFRHRKVGHAGSRVEPERVRFAVRGSPFKTRKRCRPRNIICPKAFLVDFNAKNYRPAQSGHRCKTKEKLGGTSKKKVRRSSERQRSECNGARWEQLPEIIK
jgi:hypothetical protein